MTPDGGLLGKTAINDISLSPRGRGRHGAFDRLADEQPAVDQVELERERWRIREQAARDGDAMAGGRAHNAARADAVARVHGEARIDQRARVDVEHGEHAMVGSDLFTHVIERARRSGYGPADRVAASVGDGRYGDGRSLGARAESSVDAAGEREQGESERGAFHLASMVSSVA